MLSVPRIWLLLLLMASGGPALAATPFNMPPGVTAESQQIFGLHMLIFWICVVIGVVVFGAVGLIILRHRRQPGVAPGGLHESRWLEITWTVIPVLVLAVMAVPATRVLIGLSDTSHPDLTIQITGSQWKWRYEYLGEGVSYMSDLNTPQEQRDDRAPKDVNYLREVDHPLVLPVGRKVRFLLTATDVIHSWWVPELGIKRDAIPGFINEAWARIEKPGLYRGQCAELCGLGHGYMPVVVEARSESEFAEWLRAQRAMQEAERRAAAQVLPMAQLMERGKAVFTTNCATCHQAGGEGIPGAIPPLKGSRITTGPLSEHIKTILLGRPGTAMASFAQISDTDLAALLTYERNAWGNDTGDTVQAMDVKTARTALGK
jgi:cytochrome c oxidase subunit 2